jgi:alpha-ribazole phosphatase
VALTLLRHTRPAGGDGRCYGRMEIDLAPDFAAEGDALAARLPRPDRIVTSPLGRCRRLADHLGKHMRVPVAVDADWQELDFGRWEGLPWSAVPRAELDAWAADLLHARPHGGESVAMLLARVRRALDRCDGRTLAVTHAGPIRAALFATSGDDAAWQLSIGFGEAIVVDPAVA